MKLERRLAHLRNPDSQVVQELLGMRLQLAHNSFQFLVHLGRSALD